MSQLKYQSRAPSHLTKAEVMEPRVLELNETCVGAEGRAGGCQIGRELNLKLKPELRLNQFEAIV